jgi:predicted lipid carrier protein YhbT
MASVEDCERALEGLASRLAQVDLSVKRRHLVERTIACRISDLDVIFCARLADGELRDIQRTRRTSAQIRVTVDSDDLLHLASGRLPAGRAWAEGRVRIDASLFDLLRLRALI